MIGKAYQESFNIIYRTLRYYDWRIGMEITLIKKISKILNVIVIPLIPMYLQFVFSI